MTIYRGTGGGGDATTDSQITALAAYATQAQTQAELATTAAGNAATSASNASTSASNAAASAATAANTVAIVEALAGVAPPQTGNAGKYLTTNGTATSWDALSTVADTGAYNDLTGKPTLGTAASTDSTAYVSSSVGSVGFKNRIINGAMVIDQRNAGASVTPTIQYTLDRWIAYTSAASKLSVQQNAGAITPAVGFSKYLGITSLSAYSISSSDYFAIAQIIEGNNIADLAWGTASAKSITLSFQIYSSLTGTFGGSLSNSAADRSYPFTYSIPVANTWTTISVTVAGDTSGTWLTTNGIGIRVQFGLGVGSTLSGTAGAWAAANYLSATGAVSVVGTSGATFYITGVQLEKGSTATSFDYRPYGTELALCQRYYESCFSIGTAPAAGVAAGRFRFLNMSATQTNDVSNNLFFAVSKRAVPTMTQYASTGNTVTAAFDNFGTEGGNMFASLGANAASFSHWTASAEL